MKLKLTLLILTVYIPTLTLFADSPLTSTYFALNYYDYPLIEQNANTMSYNDEVAGFLLDKKNPIDAKAALINTIGWTYETSKNADLFKEDLAKKYKTTTGGLQLSSLTASELMCLGYLMALDNYFEVDDAINVLEMAANKDSESFTIQMILAITKAQKSMDTDYCEVWELTAEVLNDKSLIRDMKTSAIQTIVNYMILYKGECYY